MFSEELEKIIVLAIQEVGKRKHEFLSLEHILYAFLLDENGRKFLLACEVNIKKLKKGLKDFFYEYDNILMMPESQKNIFIGNSGDGYLGVFLGKNDGRQELTNAIEKLFTTYANVLSLEIQQESIFQTISVQRVLHRSLLQVKSAGKDKVRIEDFLLALLEEKDSYAVFFLQIQNITKSVILRCSIDERNTDWGMEILADMEKNS